MVLPLLGTRRPESLPVEALDGSDDILRLAIIRLNSGALLSLRYEGAQVKWTRYGGVDLMCGMVALLHVSCTLRDSWRRGVG